MARWPDCFVLQSLGPRTLRNDPLAHRREWAGINVGMSSEIEWQVFMDGTMSDRKQLRENTVSQCSTESFLWLLLLWCDHVYLRSRLHATFWSELVAVQLGDYCNSPAWTESGSLVQHLQLCVWAMSELSGRKNNKKQNIKAFTMHSLIKLTSIFWKIFKLFSHSVPPPPQKKKKNKKKNTLKTRLFL